MQEFLFTLELAGNYSATEDGEDTVRLEFKEDQTFEIYYSGMKQGEGTWGIETVSGLNRVGSQAGVREVHATEKGKAIASVFKIESNGDLKEIANKSLSGREDIPKDKQRTFKKIK